MPIYWKCGQGGCTQHRYLAWIAERWGVRFSVHGSSDLFAFPPIRTIEGAYFLHHTEARPIDDDDFVEYPKAAVLIPARLQAAYSGSVKGKVKGLLMSYEDGDGSLEVQMLDTGNVASYDLPAFEIIPVRQTAEQEATGMGWYIYRSIHGEKMTFRAYLPHIFFNKAARRDFGFR